MVKKIVLSFTAEKKIVCTFKLGVKKKSLIPKEKPLPPPPHVSNGPPLIRDKKRLSHLTKLKECKDLVNRYRLLLQKH